MSLLFNTKLRKKLLTYSFTHPAQEYYVRELASIIGEDAGNLSRELRKLEKEGIFESFSKGNLKFYSLNKDYPLFKEVKKIIFKTEGVEAVLKNLISRHKGVSFAFIYGSYAKNKEKKTSDIDLVIVGKFSLNVFTRQIRKLESRLNREINFSYYSKEDFDKQRQKRGTFLDIILKDKIIILKGALNVK
ncbi:MAG: nucleotidyltransferase domain-containing protein [Candidatus Omnitrophica bacterium]|nr:nucleotidyltransferase domain-containing protein [Candidatus Omnitrophota bacterium]